MMLQDCQPSQAVATLPKKCLNFRITIFKTVVENDWFHITDSEHFPDRWSF